MTPRERFAALAGTAPAAVPLAETALWIAAEEYPDLDVTRSLTRLDDLGEKAAGRLAPATGLDATAAALGRLLFEEEGFRGNAEDYYDPRNSFLNDVLDRRLGIPITLSVVYMEVAARAGVRVHGIGLPGHFVVRLERHGDRCLLDPFNGGRPLDEADCPGIVAQLHGGRPAFDPRHLEPVTARQILVRMLANLKGIYTTLGDWRRARAAVERILLLAPDALGELRDRGTLNAKLGQAPAAIADWDTYLRRVPDADDAPAVRRQLRALRQNQATLN